MEELRINESDLNTSRMLNLMAVKSSTAMPLYLSVINRILRELRVEQQQTDGSFNYGKFKERIDEEVLTEQQLQPLKQRLDTLESFMNQTQATSYTLSDRIAGMPSRGRGGGNRAPPPPRKPSERVPPTAGSMIGNEWKPRVRS